MSTQSDVFFSSFDTNFQVDTARSDLDIESQSSMASKRTLDHLRPGDCATIAGISSSNLANRLSALGLLPSTNIHVIRQAPFFGPITVKVGNQCFSLRKADARCILVA